MKKLLLSSILCGVVALSFSACSSEPEKLVDMAREQVEIKKKQKRCDNDYEGAEVEKCLDDTAKAWTDIRNEGREIWKTLSEEEKDLTKELMKKEELENHFM